MSVRVSVFLVLLSSMACSSEDEEPPCDRLAQHVIDLRVDSAPEADRAAHRAALTNALGNTLATECKAMTAAQVDCVLAAKATTGIASCTGAASSR